MLHYQLSELFRINPGVSLYVGIFEKPAGSQTFAEVKTVQIERGGNIAGGQIGHKAGYMVLPGQRLGDVPVLPLEDKAKGKKPKTERAKGKEATGALRATGLVACKRHGLARVWVTDDGQCFDQEIGFCHRHLVKLAPLVLQGCVARGGRRGRGLLRRPKLRNRAGQR